MDEFNLDSWGIAIDRWGKELDKLKEAIPRRIASGEVSPAEAVRILDAKRNEVQANKVEANKVEGGTWKYPTVEGGTWKYPTVEGGTWKYPTVEGGTWKYPTVEGGTWKYPTVEGGTWKYPTVEGGTWTESTTEGSDWSRAFNNPESLGNKDPNLGVLRGAFSDLSTKQKIAGYELKEYKQQIDKWIQSGDVNSYQAKELLDQKIKEINTREFQIGVSQDLVGADILQKIDQLDRLYAENGTYDRTLDRPLWSPSAIMPRSRFFDPNFTDTSNGIGNPMGDLSGDPTVLSLVSAQQLKLQKQNAERRAVEVRRQQASQKSKREAEAKAQKEKQRKLSQDQQKRNRESRKEDLKRAEEYRSSVPGSSSREYSENTLSSSFGEVAGPSRFGGRIVGGTATLEALLERKPGYGQDIRRIKEAYNVREAYPDSDYQTDTEKRDYRNSIPRGYRDYLEKTMSQPPNKLPQTTKRSGGGPGRFSPSGRGVPISNASGQIIGDINGTFAQDFQRRIGLKAIEMAGGQDKWNQLSEEQQRKLRLDALDKVTPYLDTLKDLWERGNDLWGKGSKAFGRTFDDIFGKNKPNPLLPKTGGLGQGLKPLVDALKRRSPLDDWENPYKGKTPDQAEEEFFRRNPWTRPGYVPPLDPNYQPIEKGIPAAAPPSPDKPPDPNAGLRPTKWRFTWTLGHSNKNARGFGEHEYFISTIPKPDVYLIDTGPQTTGYPGLSRWWGLFVNGAQITENGSHDSNQAGVPEQFTSFLSTPEPIEFEPIPDYQPVIVAPPGPPKLDPKPKPDPKPDPLIPREPQPKPTPKRPRKPFGPPQPFGPKQPGINPNPTKPWTPPKPKIVPPTQPSKPPPKPKNPPKRDPRPDPQPDPEETPQPAPRPLPKPAPTPKPKPDPIPNRNHPPKLDPPRRPNKTTITTTTTTRLPPLIPLPTNPSDPQPNPIPDDEDLDMPCRYLPDLEQPVSLTKYDPLTKTMQPMPFNVHQGMAEALQFLATEIAEIKRSNHQINNVTEAATLDTTGKIMVPQIQAEAVGAAIFAGPGLTSPVKTLSGQMNIWASLNHMMSGHHQLGRSDFPADMMKPGGAKIKHTTALGFNHWVFNQLSNLVGMPAKHNVVNAAGVATPQNFKNQSDAIENIHAQNLGLEQDMSAVDKMLFKVLQELAQVKQIVVQNKYDIDVLIDESGAKTTQKIVKMPGTLTHGKGDSFFDKLMTIAQAVMVVREWDGDIDAKQLALKTNMEAQIAALTNKFEFDKNNPKLPILDRPKQNPKAKDEEAWKRYVNTIENPGPLRQSVGLPIPEVKEIKLGSTREISKPEKDPDKLLGS